MFASSKRKHFHRKRAVSRFAGIRLFPCAPGGTRRFGCEKNLLPSDPERNHLFRSFISFRFLASEVSLWLFSCPAFERAAVDAVRSRSFRRDIPAGESPRRQSIPTRSCSVPARQAVRSVAHAVPCSPIRADGSHPRTSSRGSNGRTILPTRG